MEESYPNGYKILREKEKLLVMSNFSFFHSVFQRLVSQGAKGVIVWEWVNPLPDDKILDRSKFKQSADDNFKFDENSRKFSKRVENTVGKGEIAHYKQFLLFPQCFQKACFPGASKGVVVWEWVKHHSNNQLPNRRLCQLTNIENVCKMLSIWTNLKFYFLVRG